MSIWAQQHTQLRDGDGAQTRRSVAKIGAIRFNMAVAGAWQTDRSDVPIPTGYRVAGRAGYPDGVGRVPTRHERPSHRWGR
jgi:hypothetical protein